MGNPLSDNPDLTIREEDVIFPTMVNRDLVLKFLDIYKSLQTSPKHKEPLYRILRSDWLYGPPFADRIQAAKDLLPSIEKLKSKECLYDALKLVRFCWDWQNNFHERKRRLENRDKTSNARQRRKIDQKLLLDLEEYLVAVEDIWHPASTDPKELLVRNHRNSRKKALTHIFQKNEKNIVAILERHSYCPPSLEKFEYLFQIYTQMYIDFFGKTRNGYTIEKRASRSEESKERSRQAAQKHMAKVKKN